MNITEFKQDIELLFSEMKEKFDLGKDFELVLEENELEQNGLQVSIPSKIRFVGYGYDLEVIDLTSEIFNLFEIAKKLTLRLKQIESFRWIHDFAESNEYSLKFDRSNAFLTTKEGVEILIQIAYGGRHIVRARYVRSERARLERLQIEEGLYLGLRDAQPKETSIKAAICIEKIVTVGFEELEEAIISAISRLDSARQKKIKIELV